MICFRAFYNGLNYFAEITKSEKVDGYDLRVYWKDWKGEDQEAFSKEFKTPQAAEMSLKRRYPAEWRQVEANACQG